MKKFLSIFFIFFFIYIFPQRYLIKANDKALNNLEVKFHAELLKTVFNYKVIDIKLRSIPNNKMLNEIKSIPGVKSAEIDYKMKVTWIPNDPFFNNYQWNLKRIGFEKYTDISKGDTAVIIAIVDSGIDSTHPDLKNKVAGGYNFVLYNSSGVPYNPTDYDDDNGHGTHCAGIAAAETNNNEGIAGVAPYCRLYAVKVMDDTGSGYDSDIADGIKWAADNGAKVISMSLGGEQAASVLKEACDYAYNKGCVLVAATGNDDKKLIDYPAKYDDVIAVGASDYGDNRASYSNYGPEIDLVAPGGDPQDGSNDWNNWILSTIPPSVSNGYSYGGAAGTSMATPHVAGAAAIIISMGISNPEEVKNILIYSTDDVGDPGWDEKTGYGRLNIYNAVSMLKIQLSAGMDKAYCFPNPFSSYVNIVFKSKVNQKVTLTIYNEFMEKLYSTEKTVSANQNVFFSWSAKGYQNGVYFFYLHGNEGNVIVKGLKVK